MKNDMHALEIKISYLLRIGVLAAGVLLLSGWVWMLVDQGDILSQFQEYKAMPLAESLQWALIMNDRALLLSFLGLFILVCLPVVRVFLTGILFFRQKDYRLGVMAFVVFGVLVFSFLLGIDL